MSDITREQFAEAVVAAISSVQHLYKEVDRLLGTLREALAEAPDPLVVVRGSTLARKGRDTGQLVVRNEYGMLFESVAEDEEEGDEDAEGNEDEVDEDVEEEESPRGALTGRKARQKFEFLPDQVYLALRVALFDPQRREGFEPQLQYAILTEVGVGPTGVPRKAGQPLTTKRYMLRRIPRALGTKADVAKGGRVLTRATVEARAGTKSVDRRLSFKLPFEMRSVALYSLDEAAAVERVAGEIKSMWAEAGGKV